MLKRSLGYELSWYIVRSSEKPFGHVTNQVHIPVNFSTLLFISRSFLVFLSLSIGKRIENPASWLKITYHRKS